MSPKAFPPRRTYHSLAEREECASNYASCGGSCKATVLVPKSLRANSPLRAAKLPESFEPCEALPYAQGKIFSRNFSMHKSRLLLINLLGMGLFAAATANAQATRTWVSGVGDDVNPCSRTAPCKTFAGAISKTAAGGEIDALDPGGFGPVTITKGITIDGGGGQVASVLSTGSNGVIINAAVTDVVTLRNLSFLGNNTQSGIKALNAKALHIEHCTISQYQNGIHIQPGSTGIQVFVSDSISQDHAGAGLYASGTSGAVQVTIDNSRFDNNQNGVYASEYARISVRNSAANGNSAAGFLAQSSSGMSKLSIVNSTAATNGVGIQAGGGSAQSSVRMANVSIFLNTMGLSTGTNGSILSFGNNFNSGDGTPSGILNVQ